MAHELAHVVQQRVKSQNLGKDFSLFSLFSQPDDM